MTDQKKAYCFALVTVGLWSTIATASKLTLKYLSPTELLFVASHASLVVLFAIICLQGKLILLRSSSRKEILQGIGYGFLNPFLYYLLLFQAYDLLPAQQAQIINYTWALTLSLLSIPLLKQKVSLKQWLAIGVSYIGVVVIATKGRVMGLEVESPLGIFFALITTVVWALYWIFNTKDGRDPVIGLFWNFTFGCPMISIFLATTDGFSGFSLPGVLGAVYIGVFEMGIAFVLWLKAMKLTVSTARIANLIFISPIASLFLIHYFVGEEILVSTVIGMVLVLGGLAIQALAQRQQQQ